MSVIRDTVISEIYNMNEQCADDELRNGCRMDQQFHGPNYETWRSTGIVAFARAVKNGRKSEYEVIERSDNEP